MDQCVHGAIPDVAHDAAPCLRVFLPHEGLVHDAASCLRVFLPHALSYLHRIVHPDPDHPRSRPRIQVDLRADSRFFGGARSQRTHARPSLAFPSFSTSSASFSIFPPHPVFHPDSRGSMLGSFHGSTSFSAPSLPPPSPSPPPSFSSLPPLDFLLPSFHRVDPRADSRADPRRFSCGFAPILARIRGGFPARGGPHVLELEHVRDVEEGGVRARVCVGGDHALVGVLDGHVPAGEGDELAAVLHVEGVEGGPLGRGGGGGGEGAREEEGGDGGGGGGGARESAERSTERHG